jgi:hypothetical protein
MAAGPEFSSSAKESLEGLSQQGRDFVLRSLTSELNARPHLTHLHAGGMCVLVEARPEGVRWVTAISPVCLESD